MATETTNKKTRVFMFIGPQTEMCKQGRLVPHGNYLRGAHTVTTPDEQLVRLCWPAFLKQFVHTGKCQPKKKSTDARSQPVGPGLASTLEINSLWLKVPLWCPFASQASETCTVFCAPSVCSYPQRKERQKKPEEQKGCSLLLFILSFPFSILSSIPPPPVLTLCKISSRLSTQKA